MAWYFSGGLLLGVLLLSMVMGVPVAIAFLLTNIVGILVFTGSIEGLLQIVENSTDLITSFTVAPVPLFVLMGALFFHTGLAHRVFDALDILLGRLPGRLAFMTVAGGTLFSTLTGSTLANAAMLGSLLVPEMQRRGYSRNMSLGPILGTGGLAMIIPPSALAVLLASVANIDVAKVLVAGLIPGIILAFLYVALIAIQIRIDPAGAPSYEVPKASWGERLRSIAVNILPMAFLIFVVVGFIVLGIATPSESAAFGAVGVILLALAYRRLTRAAISASLISTVRVTGVIFFIIMGSTVFSQLLAFTGASSGLLGLATSIDASPLVLLLIMIALLLLLGMFMDQVSMMLITIPIFYPLITILGYDPIWFAMIMLMTMEMSLTTPPFGLLLFIIMGVAPRGTTMADVVRAASPYLLCDAILILLLILFPALALFLPNLL